MNPFFVLGSFFVSIMAAVTLGGWWLMSRRPAAPGALEPSTSDVIRDTLVRFGENVPSRSAQATKYHQRLVLAGYRRPNSADTFLGLKMAVTITLGILCGAAKFLYDGDSALSFVAMCAGAGLGYMIPDRVLEYAISRRAKRILFGIPSAIDLLVLGLEAGQSLDSSLSETARELRSSYKELSQELGLVQMEMLASRSRSEAFRNLRERNSEPEMRRLAQVFTDSDRFGTSLAPALRTHVKFLRIRLRQQAYEKARKVSVKLVFPVFFLIFPSVLLVTLGPALLQVFTQLNLMVK